MHGKPTYWIKASQNSGSQFVDCLCCVHLRFFIDLIARSTCTRRLLWRMLISSKSANIPKVEVLIAIKNQVREIHEPKADILNKSKPKSRPSVLCLPLLHHASIRRIEIRPFFRNEHLHPPTVEALVIIKQK